MVNQAETLLHATFKGTAAFTGPQFFDKAVEMLANGLSVGTAFVATPVPERPGWNRLIAHWSRGALGECLEYKIDGTPCALGQNSEITSYPTNVQSSFPEDEWLREMNADSYMALQLKSSDGQPIGHLGLVHTAPLHLDETELSSLQIFGSRIAAELDRERIDRETRRESDFQSQLLESAPFGVTHRNVGTNATYNNATFEQIFGRSYQECRDLGWDRIVHPEDIDRYNDASDQLRQSGETIGSTFRVKHSDGDTRWIQRHGAAKLDAAGSPIEILTFIIDLTQVHQAHAELIDIAHEVERRSAEFASSLNAFPDMRFRLDAEGSYLSAWFGDPSELIIPPDQIVGSNIADHFPTPLVDQILDAIATTLETGAVSSLEYSTGEGHRTTHYEARLAPLDVGEVLAVVRNVSEVKTLEEQLVHAGKMQSVGRLAGGIAHDFNNVLHIIRGHASALQRQTDEPAVTERRLDAITRAVDRTTSLIERLMTISRPSPDNPSPMAIDEFLKDLGPTLSQMLGETIALDLDLGAENVVVLIDDSRFESALLNLSANAKDAMSEGGTLTIATSVDGTRARIEVTDDGIGMNRATAATVFEPFFTTKSVGIGTGLGLAMTYGTIVGARGTIRVDSKPKRGTTFTIELPLAKPSSRASVQSAMPEEDPPTAATGATILVVEDEADVLELCADSLTDLGFQVLEARDGTAALHLIEQHGHIDGVLTDVVMPGFNGVELAQEIAARHPGVPIIFMSGYSPETVADLPPERLLRKPFTNTELQRILAENLA